MDETLFLILFTSGLFNLKSLLEVARMWVFNSLIIIYFYRYERYLIFKVTGTRFDCIKS